MNRKKNESLGQNIFSCFSKPHDDTSKRIFEWLKPGIEWLFRIGHSNSKSFEFRKPEENEFQESKMRIRRSLSINVQLLAGNYQTDEYFGRQSSVLTAVQTFSWSKLCTKNSAEKKIVCAL